MQSNLDANLLGEIVTSQAVYGSPCNRTIAAFEGASWIKIKHI